MSISSEPSAPPVVRLAHLSDLHIAAGESEWRPGDWFNKRLTGWLHWHWLGRGKSFGLAGKVLQTLASELRRRRPDHVVFSGDATALGFPQEFARAAEILGVGRKDALSGLAVPGNHDYYTRGTAASGLFERCFASWQTGTRVDGQVYPFAQAVGPVWLVAINSCTGNIWPWDAAGSVGAEQLGRLAALFQRLDERPRILVTHYPVTLAGGEPENRHHGLRDLADLLAVARAGRVCLWLHGHRHTAYHLLSSKLAPFPVVCAGTATQERRWSYGDYTIAGRHLHAVRRVYSPGEDRFEDRETFDLELYAG
jgi:3',5'-cyclic AMP phosphodiesterase CpdA